MISKKPDTSKLDRIVADANRNAAQRALGYRERSLKMYPWVCGRCTREFNHSNVSQLTVHHRDHNHDNNPPDGLALLNHGLKYNGKELPPIKVSWQNETRLRFAMKAAQPFLITHMCEKVGLSVVAQKRIRIARIPMSSLPEGQWRYLLGYERF